MSKDLQVVDAKEIIPAGRIDPAGMMQAMIAKGITHENVAAFTELVKLSEHMEDRDAKRDFNRDFIELQREIPRIKATRMIPDRNGNVRSTFAPFEEIDGQARPICLRHGFTYAFSEGAFISGKVTKICTLFHVMGAERSNPYSVRIGQGPPGCSESQADGSAHSYAKRGALCDCLNIVVVGMDNDARLEGAPITEAQAEELELRVKMTDSNVVAFLKLADAPDFKSIASSKYDTLNQLLQVKERRGR